MPQRDDFYNATNCAILMEPAHGGGKTKPMTVADFATHPDAPPLIKTATNATNVNSLL